MEVAPLGSSDNDFSIDVIGYNIRDEAFRFTAQPGTVRDSADPLPLSTTSAYSTAQGRQSH
jgi:hypothetical protein